MARAAPRAAITEVVLAELAGAIAERLERLGDGDVFGFQAQLRAGKTHLGETGAQTALSGDERCSTCGASLLCIPVGEQRVFVRDAVDVGRLVAHHALGIAAEVRLTDVVSPHDQNVGFLRHRIAPFGFQGLRYGGWWLEISTLHSSI
jgi:hypothetical protein